MERYIGMWVFFFVWFVVRIKEGGRSLFRFRFIFVGRSSCSVVVEGSGSGRGFFSLGRWDIEFVSLLETGLGDGMGRVGFIFCFCFSRIFFLDTYLGIF